jgi:hypothetical protein
MIRYAGVVLGLKKFGSWFIENWKLLLFPIWVISLVFVWFFKSNYPKYSSVNSNLSPAIDAISAEKSKVLTTFQTQLDELVKKARERLQTASMEQIKEFDDLKGKSLEDLAKWLDSN